MMQSERPPTHDELVLEQYTHVWQCGTGLPASLPPGTHLISGRYVSRGQTFVVIDGAFYLPVEHLASTAEGS